MSVSVFEEHPDDLRPSVASADRIDDVWWISRVLVQPNQRGRGVGTKLLKALIEECRKQGGREMQVSPGGYNSDPIRQRAFYVRAGFKPSPDSESLLVLVL